MKKRGGNEKERKKKTKIKKPNDNDKEKNHQKVTNHFNFSHFFFLHKKQTNKTFLCSPPQSETETKKIAMFGFFQLSNQILPRR